MRATVVGGSISTPIEPRHRLSLTSEEPNKRRSLRSRVFKDSERPFHIYGQGRNFNCKFSTLKFVLVILVLGTFLTLLHSPALHNSDHPPNSLSRTSFVDRWIWETHALDHRYISASSVNWDNVFKVIEKLTDKNDYQGVGLLNFNEKEIHHFKEVLPNAEHIVLKLHHASQNITWDTLYPEWIDEEEEFEIPYCPTLPSIQVPIKPRLDIIAIKLPCNKSGDWSRDVARFHLQIAAARLASTVKGYYPIRLLFVSDCFPVPSLFTCKELVARIGSVWLYQPDLNRLREKIQLPVGSCELAVPLKAKDNWYAENEQREAYATILHSAHVYVCGAIAAAQSIRMAGSKRDFVILVDETISEYHRGGLEAAGYKVRVIQRIRNPKAEKDAYNEWNYSKFRLWQLTDYDKIIFIDADLLILRNIDFLFEMPEITAIGNNGTLFNSGVMIVEPSNCTFQLLMDHINEIVSYNGGDQGYLNEIFTWWHRIPKHMNFLKHFWEGDEPEKKEMKTRLFGSEPPVLYVIHYLGLKPWLCFRDYDCNWNVDILHEYASDVAHKRWWKVHDAMPNELQKFCLLRSKQKAALEWDRRQAEKGNYTDEHWKIEIKDERLKTCFEDFCFWESMLWHWGDANWTDNATTVSQSPPTIISSATLPLL